MASSQPADNILDDSTASTPPDHCYRGPLRLRGQVDPGGKHQSGLIWQLQ
jgi:hypothetical protein